MNNFVHRVTNMKKQQVFSLFGVIILLVLLSACGARIRANAAGSSSAIQSTQAPSATPTEWLTPTLRPTPTATATPLSESSKAVQVALDYFTALNKNDFEAASDLVSNFSLIAFNMTNGDAAAELHKKMVDGTRWSDLNVSDNQVFDDQTVLITVSYTLTTRDAKTGQEQKGSVEERWPFRKEAGKWRYNWNNLVDFRTLQSDAQTINGITVLPLQVQRYTDHMDLVMLMQNRTNEALVFGQVNEILGTFHFGDQTVEANKTQIILNPLRSEPDVRLSLSGLFTKYPDSVEIRKWKNYQTKPWYVFDLKK